MESFESIVVITDPTEPDSPALLKARRLARRLHSKVELLLCDITRTVTEGAVAGSRTFADAEIESARASYQTRLQVLSAPFIADRIDVTTRVEFGKPLSTVILDRVKSVRPSLVIKDTHHHSLLRRTLLTNTDWHLIRDCQAPLLLVKAQPWGEELRISAAVDPGHPADQPAALDHALVDSAERLARGFGTATQIVHCWSPINLIAMGAMGGLGGVIDGVQMGVPPELIDAERKLDAERLEHLARVHGIPRDRVHLRAGTAVDELPAYAAQTRVDVLAMGALARSGIDRVFIGHTAERLLETLPCDVLVIKLPNQAQP